VAFDSHGTTLVPDDTNNASDVFVRDRLLRTTERVSVSSTGDQTAALRRPHSNTPTISADGRFVAFASFASNLAPNDTNTTADVFVRDRLAGTTELVSVSMGGTSGDSDSGNPTLSADGRWIAFWSTASDLVPGDVMGTDDVFLADRTTGTVELVSATWNGTPNDAPTGIGPFSRPAISDDARYVSFTHPAGNIVPDDTNGLSDVFVRDRAFGTTERLSLGVGGVEANGRSIFTAMSADGRFVAFESEASNLVAGDGNGVADVFVADRQTGAVVRVSTAGDGTEANDFSSKPAMSADGRRIAFYSKASNLVPKDSNGKYLGLDVFVRSLEWP
jgi:Tol biopolymer transport system component